MKKKYKRSIIKLGNSKAITFPQEWTKGADLKEKSEITLYPLDNKTLMVRSREKGEEKRIYRMNGVQFPIKLIRQAILSAFKLNVDIIHLKYNSQKKEELYELLINLRREIIGIDFKDKPETNEFYISFLLDASKTDFNEVIKDLVSVFHAIMENIVKGNANKTSDLLLDEVDRKYSLGTRILVTGLSRYPISQYELPIIRFLGDRVILLYIRDFINEALINFKEIPKKIITKYSELLLAIPELLDDLIKNYNNINIKTISEFQDELLELEDRLKEKEFKSDQAVCNVRNLIKYYLRGFMVFFDIAITRMIESEIGL
jgi:antitoxin component of MazEF toxin-antitoxin module